MTPAEDAPCTAPSHDAATPAALAEENARGLGQFPRRRGGGWVRQIALTSFLPGAVVIDFPDDLCAAA
jgi:hypothetical protein